MGWGEGRKMGLLGEGKNLLWDRTRHGKVFTAAVSCQKVQTGRGGVVFSVKFSKNLQGGSEFIVGCKWRWW